MLSISNFRELVAWNFSFRMSFRFVTTTSYVWQQDSDMGETCFTSKKSAKEIVSTIEKAARPLGFNVQIQNHKIKLKADKEGRKGQLSVSTQVCCVLIC